MNSLGGAGVTYVLVEEEEPIRSKWREIAFDKGLDLVVYDSPESFLADFIACHFGDRHRFYLDQDWGTRRGIGVALARIIRARRENSYICLITAYPRMMFTSELAEGLLSDVDGKYPAPFESTADTAFERRFEEQVWRPLFADSAFSAAMGGRS